MNTLDSTRRALDKAQSEFQKHCLSGVVRTDSKAWNDMYYSSSSLKAFTRRYEAFSDEEPGRGAHMRPAFDAVAIAWAAYEAARLEEKARKADKRAAVAAKRDLKAELNLQEGVSLKGVDVGQYKVILAGLEPVRLHVYEARKRGLYEERDLQVAQLRLHVWNKVAAYPDRRFPRHADTPAHFNTFFKEGPNQNCVGLRPESEIREYIEQKATEFALAYVQGYACKLAIKVGETVANDPAIGPGYSAIKCSVSSTSLWQDSDARITLKHSEGGEYRVTFHTQIIWNRSCLGKVFNQYPTRRVL